MKQISYAESRGEKPFDWNEFLNRETITEKEWMHAYGLSGSWVMCACGHQCDIIPRWQSGMPMDRILSDLGDSFVEFIGYQNKKESLRILHKIERRSTQLIAELTKK